METLYFLRIFSFTTNHTRMNRILILSLLKSYIIHNYTLFRKVFSIPYATIILFFIFATLSRYFAETSVIV